MYILSSSHPAPAGAVRASARYALAAFAAALLSLASRAAGASPAEDAERAPRGVLTVLSGLQQPILLRGANIAATYRLPNGLYLEASFGFRLRYDGVLSSEDDANYDHVESPLTGGIGIGYFYKGFSAVFEPKLSGFEITPTGSPDSFSYTVFTLGAGLYYDWRVWRNLVIQPTVKYWPKVASTLDGGERMITRPDGTTFVHEARTPGANGFIFGASLGWAFDL